MTYEKLTALIEEALVEHWNLSVQKYDDIYGYVLYTTGDLSSIFPVYNRETDLKRDKNDASYNYYRYVAVEWQNFDETNIFETTNKSIQKNITLIVGQDNLYIADIVKWNKDNPNFRYQPVYKEKPFTGVSFLSTPTFYFLKNGKIKEKVNGWPDKNKITAIKKGFQKIDVKF